MSKLWTYIALAAPVLVPALARAVEGAVEHEVVGPHDFHLVDMLPGFVNFGLLLLLLYWLLGGPISRSLKNRQESTQQALEEAAQMKAAAEAKQKEYSERLAKLDAELEQMKRDVVEAGQAERDRIIKEAEQRASRMRKEAEFLIEQRAKQLRIELTREAVNAATQAAEQLLVKATSDQDQQRLADEYLAQLKSQTRAAEAEQQPAPLRQESRA